MSVQQPPGDTDRQFRLDMLAVCQRQNKRFGELPGAVEILESDRFGRPKPCVGRIPC